MCVCVLVYRLPSVAISTLGMSDEDAAALTSSVSEPRIHSCAAIAFARPFAPARLVQSYVRSRTGRSHIGRVSRHSCVTASPSAASATTDAVWSARMRASLLSSSFSVVPSALLATIASILCRMASFPMARSGLRSTTTRSGRDAYTFPRLYPPHHHHHHHHHHHYRRNIRTSSRQSMKWFMYVMSEAFRIGVHVRM